MKTKISGISCVMFLLLCSANSQAAMVEVIPVSQTVNVGTQAVVDVTISGLGEFSAPSLGAFDLDVSFDPSILAVNSVTYGDQLDLFGFGSITDTTPGFGFVNLFELSLDSPFDLDTLQEGSFTLATIVFDTLGLGTSPLDPFVNALGDSFGAPLAADVTGASVSVVPVPGAVLLFGSGLLVLIGWGRLRKA